MRIIPMQCNEQVKVISNHLFRARKKAPIQYIETKRIPEILDYIWLEQWKQSQCNKVKENSLIEMLVMVQLQDISNI